MAANVVLILLSVLLFLFIWAMVLINNALRLMRVLRLDEEDKPDKQGWILWGLSIGSLFTGCCVAVILWVVIEWVIKPLDPFEDRLGTIQLISSARVNVTFMIVSNLLLLVLIALAQSLGGG